MPVITSTPILVLLDFSKNFVEETNAFEAGIGVVLMYEGHPIAYLSKALLDISPYLPMRESS